MGMGTQDANHRYAGTLQLRSAQGILEFGASCGCEADDSGQYRSGLRTTLDATTGDFTFTSKLVDGKIPLTMSACCHGAANKHCLAESPGTAPMHISRYGYLVQ